GRFRTHRVMRSKHYTAPRKKSIFFCKNLISLRLTGSKEHAESPERSRICALRPATDLCKNGALGVAGSRLSGRCDGARGGHRTRRAAHDELGLEEQLLARHLGPPDLA